MKRLLEARSSVAVVVAALVALVVGGSYALARGGSRAIHACVHRQGGGLYVARRCARHDRKISWNQVGPKGATGASGATGPQGPGATSLVYNAVSSPTPTRTTIGAIGPWTATGLCIQTGGGGTTNTTTEIDLTGPGLQGDGFNIFNQNTSQAVSSSASGPINNAKFAGTNPTPTQIVGSGQFVLTPSAGAPVQLFATVLANGPAPPAGTLSDATPNTCHFRVTVIPVAAPSGLAASVGRGGRGWRPLLAER